MPFFICMEYLMFIGVLIDLFGCHMDLMNF